MADLTPSDVLREYGVSDPRSCIRALARHGYGFARIDATTDLPDLATGDMVAEPDRDGGVLLDLTRALHPEHVATSTVDGAPVECIAMVLAGRVNQSDRRVRVALILHADAAAQIIGHLARFTEIYPTFRDALRGGRDRG